MSLLNRRDFIKDSAVLAALAGADLSFADEAKPKKKAAKSNESGPASAHRSHRRSRPRR